MDTQLIEIFEDLSNEGEDIRLKAAQRLLEKISPERQPSDEQLQKILSRLIRGLCSCRKAARLGFSVAFTEILISLFSHSNSGTADGPTIPKLFETLEEQTHVAGNISGQVNVFDHLDEGSAIDTIVNRKSATTTMDVFLVLKQSSSLEY